MRKLILYRVKNSQAIIEKITIAVRISPILLSTLKFDVANLLPTLKKMINADTGTIIIGLNLDIQETIIAVNPCPPTIDGFKECLSPATIIKPTIPHIAPDIATVRIITLFTLIPMYLAVFSLSPTTEIS